MTTYKTEAVALLIRSIDKILWRTVLPRTRTLIVFDCTTAD